MNKILEKGEYLDQLLRSPRTVFSTKDVALMWNEPNEATVADRLKRYARSGKLIRVRRGFYVKDKQYDRMELAARIYTPSYIGFETVLTREGVNFQFYESIFVASYVNREIIIDGQVIKYVRMKPDVLSNIEGIEHRGGVAFATKERAFLDRLLISKDYHFDNITSLNWERVHALLPIYHNKRLAKKVRQYEPTTKTL
jgi:predicted transcriptional regulator of viral defense system